MPYSDPPALSAHDRILLAAHDLFYQHGIRATGVDGVIAAAGVTKVTFYRHFPSKNDLVLAFLAYRHETWMAWFHAALSRHAPRQARPLDALVPALREWMISDSYRGCAFINATAELGATLPEAMTIVRKHKADMTAAIAALLPPGRGRKADAEAIALAVDGAIVHAQMDDRPDAALRVLARLLQPVLAARSAP